jgi:hypothetical protein
MDGAADRTSVSTSRSSEPGERAVSWRQVGRHLWVGRCDDMPVGMIEEGRRFTFIDADDRPHGGFATLEAAQAAQAAAGRARAVPDPAAADAATDAAEPASAETSGPRLLRLTPASVVALTASLSVGGLVITLLRFGSTLFLIR